jgi:hypothetical protein
LAVIPSLFWNLGNTSAYPLVPLWHTSAHLWLTSDKMDKMAWRR